MWSKIGVESQIGGGIMYIRGKKTIKRIIACFLICFIVLGIGAQSIFAESSTNGSLKKTRTVRVGFYEMTNFLQGADDSTVKFGYGYEYLQKISNYTDWKYEYVYGSWSELYNKFLNGEIDLLPGVSKTEQREQEMLFPDYEMGEAKYYIYKTINANDIDDKDYSSYEGKKIGTVRDTNMTSYLLNWIEANNVNCEVVYYDGFAERDKAVRDGKIELFIGANNYILPDIGYQSLDVVGTDTYYLAVTQTKSYLKDTLNEVLADMGESNPYFLESLQLKYFQQTTSNIKLLESEKAWVERRGTLTIGYIDDYLPFCDEDKNGEVTGVIVDVIEEWQETLNLSDSLKIKYIPYKNFDDMKDGLINGVIDTAFPVVDSIWYSEQCGMEQTSPVLSSTIAVIYKEEYSDKIFDNIALSDHSPMQQTMVALNYADSKKYYVNSTEECLEAVNDGEATCTIFNSSRVEKYITNSDYSSLKAMTLGTSVDYCFGVKEGNKIVYSLLERGFCTFDKAQMTNRTYKYVDNDRDYSLVDFARDNVLTVFMICIVIIALIGALFILYVNQSIKRNRADAIHMKELKRLSEEAQSANRAKTAFLNSMSHDIRTPMNAVIGFSNLMEKNQDNPERLKDYISKIQDAGKVLLSIINNVLEMARIEKGSVEVDETAVCVEQFMETINSVFTESMREKNIEFTCEMNLVHKYVFGDILKIREVFLNLISNAYKYTESGGRVSVTMEELECDKPGCTIIKTTISDTGIGMDEDFVPHLFEEFTREKGSVGNKIEGTGLGMPIVKRLLDFMDGSIEVYSKKGKGSTFVVTIPHRIADKSDIVEPIVVEVSQDDLKGKRILVAEDNDLNYEIAEEILKDAGFIISRAEDGQVCVDKLLESPEEYDLVLMDIQMPNLNGYEATKKIRGLENSKASSIPIVAMTANAFEEDKKAAFEAGMNGHISKPIVVPALMQTLKEVFQCDGIK